jgi:hypothetical protein
MLCINAESPGLVLLLHHYNRAFARGGDGFDVLLLKKLLDMMLDFFIFHQRAIIDWSIRQRLTGG